MLKSDVLWRVTTAEGSWEFSLWWRASLTEKGGSAKTREDGGNGQVHSGGGAPQVEGGNSRDAGGTKIRPCGWSGRSKGKSRRS